MNSFGLFRPLKVKIVQEIGVLSHDRSIIYNTQGLFTFYNAYS